MATASLKKPEPKLALSIAGSHSQVTHIDARIFAHRHHKRSLVMKDNIALLARKIPKKLGNISLRTKSHHYLYFIPKADPAPSSLPWKLERMR